VCMQAFLEHLKGLDWLEKSKILHVIFMFPKSELVRIPQSVLRLKNAEIRVIESCESSWKSRIFEIEFSSTI